MRSWKTSPSRCCRPPRPATTPPCSRFYREARAVAALTHPNIVHAYDIDQDEQLHFLVMEYVDGASLQDLVKNSGPLDIGRACHYIRQSANGLEHASRAGLVHRDIKPGNILVARDGGVKILDMGLARFFNDDDDNVTKKFEETVLGTADYLAPEQALDSHSVDIRADIYSLGATFFYLLTGRTPFGDGTVAQKLIWHQSRQPKPVTEYRKDVPPDLAALLLKMMAKLPDDRYPDATGVVGGAGAVHARANRSADRCGDAAPEPGRAGGLGDVGSGRDVGGPEGGVAATSVVADEPELADAAAGRGAGIRSDDADFADAEESTADESAAGRQEVVDAEADAAFHDRGAGGAFHSDRAAASAEAVAQSGPVGIEHAVILGFGGRDRFAGHEGDRAAAARIEQADVDRPGREEFARSEADPPGDDDRRRRPSPWRSWS